ncbi:predicted protein [Thalassiosira pseudonana CCMP1335]|uniref:Uncharacterized protein n=1 Tax=Thalassiosira pseudonana TaxID=35128 RepID=B8CFC6_THAPS|nr:predicted protein [Thalassiosira pseudonana CCMP1335]EED87604.1 predicted protein [Thalassiosira pseudonana CCMP1335]|eukprot:g5266.t1 g5266   contig2:116958-119129(-)
MTTLLDKQRIIAITTLLGFILLWHTYEAVHDVSNASTSLSAEVALAVERESSSNASKNPPLLNECGHPVSSSTNQPQPVVCSKEHQRAIEYCSTDDHNHDEKRKDKNAVAWEERRPYSITPSLEDGYNNLPECRDVGEYLTSIKLGRRVWNENVTTDVPMVKETIPSKFVPSHCHVPLLPPSPEKTCEILNQFSHVILHGDSLTRHLRQAMLMAMRGDYITGGLPYMSEETKKLCSCDGTFSENIKCRKIDLYFPNVVQPKDFPGAKVCANLDSVNQSFAFGKVVEGWDGDGYPKNNIDWEAVDCTNEEYRGMLLYLQGGMHYGCNASRTFERMVEPVLSNPKYQECRRRGKILTLWNGLRAQSRTMDEKYPHQSKENAIVFNEEMKQLFQSRDDIKLGKDVLVLDWYNMTSDAPSSDGVHSLSDVNLAMAAQILYLIEHWPWPKETKVAIPEVSSSSSSLHQTSDQVATTAVPKPQPSTNRERTPTVHFRTYADERFVKSKRRILQEANETGWFKTVQGLGPEDLSESFRNRFREILELKRGGGYWIWKYAVIEQTLKEMEDGDFLVYLDAGSSINKGGELRFRDYLEMVDESEYDMICIQLRFPEHRWTTKHVFDAFNVTKSDTGIYYTGQYEGGTLLMQKGPHLMKWLSKVNEVLTKDAWLITDKYNNKAREFDNQFKEGRHDQSISSVSRKQIGCVRLDSSESHTSDDDKPFHVTRIKE